MGHGIWDVGTWDAGYGMWDMGHGIWDIDIDMGYRYRYGI
jgi:hypothetical protein